MTSNLTYLIQVKSFFLVLSKETNKITKASLKVPVTVKGTTVLPGVQIDSPFEHRG